MVLDGAIGKPKADIGAFADLRVHGAASQRGQRHEEGASMPLDTFVHQITAAGSQAIHLTPLLIGVYIAWRHHTSRRGAPVVALVR